MASLLLSFALFALFALLGQAAIRAIDFRIPVIRSWLLSPAIGLAVLVLIVTPLNQAGLPVKAFGPLLGIALVTGAAAVLWWRRPVWPTRQLLPCLLILCGASLYVGWPALKFGFNWLSYVNDDMANYCLAALRLLHNGFYRLPTLAELNGTDYSQFFWFMHVSGFIRFGSEMLLAFVASVTGLNPVNIFMPSIMALALVQICAAAALVLHQPWLRRHALLTALFLAISPLFLLGTLYQLIAQVGGIALLLATFALLTHPARHHRILSQGLLSAVVGAALCLFYPEATPFLFLSYAIYTLQGLRTSRREFSYRLLIPAVALVFALLFLRENIFVYLITLLAQTHGGLTAGNLAQTLFPYFLVPSGLADLFGLLPIATLVPGPWLSLLILLGALLLLLTAFICVIGLKQRRPFACLLAIFLALGGYLFLSGNDFGTFKLALYIQPLLFAALTWPLSKRRLTTVVLGSCVMFAATFSSALRYSNASLGETSDGFAQLRHISQLGVRPLAAPPGAPIIADAANAPAIKLLAATNIGRDLRFPARDYFTSILDFGRNPEMHPALLRLYPRPGLLRENLRLMAAYNHSRPPNATLDGSQFVTTPAWSTPAIKLATFTHNWTLLNAIYPRPPVPAASGYFHVRSEVTHPWLLFKNSSLGNSYYLGYLNHISSYQPSADYFLPGGMVAGLGRVFILQVLHAPGPVYLHLALSRTLLGANGTQLPPFITIRGQHTRKFRLTGHGAASVFLGPIDPIQIDGQNYLALDFEQPAQAFPINRSGLMNWYNHGVNLDPRLMVAFGRDISAVTPAYMDALRRPVAISRFPQDLLNNPGLEFSGIYEDGWISRQAFIVLGEHAEGAVLQITGTVPALGGFARVSQELDITVEDSAPHHYALPPGPFAIAIPLTRASSRLRVDFHFVQITDLPSPDNRPIAAKLDSILITPPAAPSSP